MIAPIASDAPSRLYRMFFPGGDAACCGAAPARPAESAASSLLRPAGAARAGDLFPEGPDRFEASGYSLSYLHVRAELSFERTVYDRAGQTLSHESLSLTYERTQLLALRYGGGEPAGPGAEAAGETEGAAGDDPFQALRDYASPQNTANRILRFVEDGFHGGRFSGGTGAEAREAFRAFIVPVIEGAAQDVLDAFGDALPEGVRDLVRRTLELIREGLGRFAEGGAAAVVVAGEEPEAHAA
jgi:hypothetical protein